LSRNCRASPRQRPAGGRRASVDHCPHHDLGRMLTQTLGRRRIMNSQSPMYDVGGVLLPRPFKARRLGHFALWHTDVDMARRLYVDALGFRHTDKIMRGGEVAAVFTSHGTDHLSLAAIHASTAEGVRKQHYENGVFVNQISF